MTKHIANVKNFVRCCDGATRGFSPLELNAGVPEYAAAWDYMQHSEFANNSDMLPGSVVWGGKRIIGFKNINDNSFVKY